MVKKKRKPNLPLKYALSAGIIWGAAMFLLSLINFIAGGKGAYGSKFLELFASIYPGYSVGMTAGCLLLGIYSFIDMFIFIFLVGWLATKLKV